MTEAGLGILSKLYYICVLFSESMIALIDYESGNIGSIKNMLKKLGHDSVITNRHEQINEASHIILPGVGAFDYGMEKLAQYGLTEVLDRKKESGTPILGICLGAQLMCETSEEGRLPGLGWISAAVKRFPKGDSTRRHKIPHMGWDVVEPVKQSNIFWDVPQPARFYFVHSYYIDCRNATDVLIVNEYSTTYHSAFETRNIIGVQFHPEKSHKFGKQLLKNFIEKY